MRGTWGPQFLALLLLLAVQILPGRGNEGSITGSCRCDTPFYSHSPPTVQQMEHFRKQLKGYDQCTPLVRFHLPRRIVCGGSRDPWVITLIHCLDRKECGRASSEGTAYQKHSSPRSSQAPGSTERAPAVPSISAQTHPPPTLQSTQQHTLPAALPLDENLTDANETTSPVGHSLEAGENQQLDGNVGPTAGTPVTVPVLCLLAISFVLTGVLLYVLCKRSNNSPQYSPDLQLQYTHRLPDSQHMG